MKQIIGKHSVLAVLYRHIGADKAIGVAQLSKQVGISPRCIRRLITELRMEGNAICGHPSTGYYVAETADELEQTCAFLKHRALHSLTLASRLSNVPLPDLLGQLHLTT